MRRVHRRGPGLALQRAKILVLVFPTWWFGLPALLKGWFDRVWAPGVAFDHPTEPGGRITPKLGGLRHCLVVTTLGWPWWFDRLIVRRPLRRVLKKVLIGTCAPAGRFDIPSLYSAMALEQPRLKRFLVRSTAPCRERSSPVRQVSDTHVRKAILREMFPNDRFWLQGIGQRIAHYVGLTSSSGQVFNRINCRRGSRRSRKGRLRETDENPDQNTHIARR